MRTELILFVEKANRLEKSNFWKWVLSKKNADIKNISENDWLTYSGLERDAIEAFCLNLRLLIQNKDGFSIWQIHDISKNWGNEFKEYSKGITNAVEKLNSELNLESLINVYRDRPTKNKDLFEIIFYGGIVHMNPNKRDKFIELTEAGLFSFIVFRSFLKTLAIYRNCIQNIAYNIVQYFKLNENYLRDL